MIASAVPTISFFTIADLDIKRMDLPPLSRLNLNSDPMPPTTRRSREQPAGLQIEPVNQAATSTELISSAIPVSDEDLSDADRSSSNENSGEGEDEEKARGQNAVYTRGSLNRGEWRAAQEGIASVKDYKIISGRAVSTTYFAFKVAARTAVATTSETASGGFSAPVIRIGPKGSKYERPSCSCAESLEGEQLCRHVFLLQDILQSYPSGPASLQALNHSGSAYRNDRSFRRLFEAGIPELARRHAFFDDSPSTAEPLADRITSEAFLGLLNETQREALLQLMGDIPTLPALYAKRINDFEKLTTVEDSAAGASRGPKRPRTSSSKATTEVRKRGKK